LRVGGQEGEAAYKLRLDEFRKFGDDHSNRKEMKKARLQQRRKSRDVMTEDYFLGKGELEV